MLATAGIVVRTTEVEALASMLNNEKVKGREIQNGILFYILVNPIEVRPVRRVYKEREAGVLSVSLPHS